ncbi:CDP-2,3-bis-(O-geranylgeranyl)-sn-glycerol synthase [Nanoarchaeota archaeon]
MGEILMLIWYSFYFMLPAYFANMAPILIKKVNFLNLPVDFGKKLNGIRIFGENKTWRGLFFGTLIGIIVFLIQQQIGVKSLIDYSQYSLLGGVLFGFLLGFGALSGDLIESFFKRRVGIKPGKSWIPFDQIDLAIGALIFTWAVYSYSLPEVLAILGLTFVLPILANRIGYTLKIRDVSI